MTTRRGAVAGVFAAVVAAMAVLFAVPSPAAAHNVLIDTDPQDGAVLDDAPGRVELTFVEPLNPEYTTIVVTDADQEIVETAGPHIDGGQGSVTFPQPLPSGTYTVAYRVISLDGHPVDGSFSFTVEGDGAAAEGTGSDPATPGPGDEVVDDAAGDEAAADDNGDRGGGNALLIGAVAVGAVLVAAAGLLLARRRRT